MADQPQRSRDANTTGASQNVTLILCVLVPIVGLFFAFYAKQHGESWANAMIAVGFVALAVWIGLILVL